MMQQPPDGMPATSIETSEQFSREVTGHESGKNLMSLLDTLGAAVSTIDRQWRYTYVNPLAAALLGRPQQALLGQLVWDLLPETIADCFATEARLASQENTVRQFEGWYPALNCWFESRIYPSPAGILVVSQDISAQKKNELSATFLADVEEQFSPLSPSQNILQSAQWLEHAQARESEARFRTLADNISQLAWMADQSGWIFWYNQRWYDYTGTTLQEMQGWGWQKVHHPDHVQRVREKFRHYLAIGEIWEDTFPLRGKDGEYRWFLSRAIPLKDEKGRVLRWFGTNTDVTEQWQAEEALRQLTMQQEATLAQLDSLLQHAPVGMAFFDLQHRYLRINDFLADINGVPTHEHIGKTVKEVLPDLATFIDVILDDIVKTHQPFMNLEVVGKTPKVPGITRYWLTCYYPVMDKANREVESIGAIIMEISDRKKMEQQKDEFIGVASHELKTPVTSLKAYAQLLERRFRKDGDTHAASLLQKMGLQLNKLTTLVEELLDVTKIENGQLQLHFSSFDSNTLINEVVEETQRVATRQRIVRDLTDSVTLMADRDRIGQVLTNLLTNAIKYSPQADTILVHTVCAEDKLIISVRDFGIGIAKEKQSKLFERFFRVEGESQLTYPGLGLGLYISAEFVKRHHGSIWIESEPGQGTTVSFSLPLSLPDQP
ncbi:hypothetical protein KDA_42180 [Dictyobacter alpinus]|uniref:histidine kinase n=1 Tax=Dictyobacter alpinus TaxID=2014873 RepID=A0A402BBM6_9CHLR|nr:PAS domain-containing protein [Dictyobacter alpinus]GCE28734.1 hypothetical protein KDA_42180 [Dictyobacter alpinus]